MAFEAFACERFDTGHWLRADYAVRCDGAEYADVRTLAVLALLLYPIGIPLAYGGLLFLARRALLDGKPTVLSQALTFLHGEYHARFFWWELAEVRAAHLRMNMCTRVFFWWEAGGGTVRTAPRARVDALPPASRLWPPCVRRCCAAFCWSASPC